MARKIVLKRLCKRLPTERAIDLDDMDDRMNRQIEGVAEPGYEPLALTAPDEEPINTVDLNGAGDRDHEPARATARQTARAAQAPLDDDGDGGAGAGPRGQGSMDLGRFDDDSNPFEE
jgi:hypothetical protein